MAKKTYTKSYNLHKDCLHCREVKNEFLTITGKPILGECDFNESRFLLNELTECKRYKKY